MGERFVEFEAIDVGTKLSEALEKIKKEFGETLVGCHLTVIDKYFLKIKDTSSDKYANVFATWMKQNEIRTLCVYSRTAEPGYDKFWGQLQNVCEKMVDCKLEPSLNTTHDRVWLSTHDFKKYTAVTVGTSLNGLGRQLCFVNKLPDSDVKVLLGHM